ELVDVGRDGAGRKYGSGDSEQEQRTQHDFLHCVQGLGPWTRAPCRNRAEFNRNPVPSLCRHSRQSLWNVHWITLRAKRRAPWGALRDNRREAGLQAVAALAVLDGVQAFGLVLFRGTQADDQVDDLVTDERDRARPEQGHADSPQLRLHLGKRTRVAPRPGDVVVDAGPAELGVVEHAGEDRTEDAADAVDAEDVERVIVAEGRLELGHREQADDAGERADDE